ncbi:hypothetical protein [Streptomyces cucumeris]|uniref:hypothetical protein n=1 Tax=Streptomyces cucumeris TaxID=2962890 RepID=UPI0020C8EC3A|nr:hypothetical protein [Streptomyces sp. NEAU-Y11]MCP9209569.1 hypothetical protein [Streptomyces sp. NEAU-Y11]
MSLEEILMTHDGYTDTAYASCGDKWCTETILKCVGVTEGLLAEVPDLQDINDLEIGDKTQITVAMLGESDSCEWCACCGTFLRHGLHYEGEEIGCNHGSEADDAPNLPGPHVNLVDAPAMREWWGLASGKG